MPELMQRMIGDAQLLCSRLKSHDGVADKLITKAQALSKQVDAMKQYEEEAVALNETAHQKPRDALVQSIQQENIHLRELQQENKELSHSLEEHQNTLELIMSKYRSQVGQLIKMQLPGSSGDSHQTQQLSSMELPLVTQYSRKVQEMAAVMKRAADADQQSDSFYRQQLAQLQSENQGLRELLRISRQHSSGSVFSSGSDACASTIIRSKPPAATQEIPAPMVTVTQNPAATISTQDSAASTITTQDSAARITTQDSAAPITTQDSASTSSTQDSAVSTITTQDSAAPITTQYSTETISTQDSAASTIMTQYSAATISTQDSATSTITTQDSAADISTQDPAAPVTTQDSAAGISTQDPAAPVTTQDPAAVTITTPDSAAAILPQDPAAVATTQNAFAVKVETDLQDVARSPEALTYDDDVQEFAADVEVPRVGRPSASAVSAGGFPVSAELEEVLQRSDVSNGHPADSTADNSRSPSEAVSAGDAEATQQDAVDPALLNNLRSQMCALSLERRKSRERLNDSSDK